jgi:hypothetical protein
MKEPQSTPVFPLSKTFDDKHSHYVQHPLEILQSTTLGLYEG